MTGDPLYDEIVRFSRRHGRGPTPAEVRAAADFRQPGGIERLCSALAQAGHVVAQRKAEAA